MKKKLCDNIYDKRYSEIMSRIRNTRLPGTHSFFSDILYRHGMKTGDKLLDSCCGVGETLFYLNEVGYIVDGFDASEGAVEIAKENNPKSNIFISKAENFSSGLKNVYNGVYVVQSFHLLESQEDFISEVCKVLKTNGIFIFEFRNVHVSEKVGVFFDDIEGIKREVKRTVKNNTIYSEYDYEDGIVTHVAKMHSPWDIQFLLGKEFDVETFYGGYNLRQPKWNEDKYVTVVARKK